MKPKYLTERDGVWHVARRVPKRYAALDTRSVIKHSTGVAVASDPNGTRAKTIRDVFNSVLEAAWRALAAGQPLDAGQHYAETRKRARMLGVAYLPADEVARLPLDRIVERLELLSARGAERDEISQDAVLGAAVWSQHQLDGVAADIVAQQQQSEHGADLRTHRALHRDIHAAHAEQLFQRGEAILARREPVAKLPHLALVGARQHQRRSTSRAISSG
jgi:hypothetical protein